MVFLKYFNKESPLDSPFAPKLKSAAAVAALAPELISAGGSALASLIGGIFGSSSQDSANATNLEIARMNQQSQRETNALNERLYNASLAYNNKMWEKQNAYNDPSEQVRRLLRAGINPSAVFGNGSVSEAGSLTSPTPPVMEAPTLDYQKQPYDISGAFQGAVNAFTQSRLASAAINKSEEETAGVRLDNEEKQKGMLDRLKYLTEMAKHEGYIGELAKTQLAFEQKAFNIRQAMLGADYTMQLKQINLAQEQFNQARLQNGLYQVQLAYAPKLNEAQLKQYYETVNQIKAQIGLINANKLLTDEQRLHEIEKKTSTIIDNGLKGLGYDIQKQTKDFVIDMSKQESIQMRDKTKMLRYESNMQGAYDIYQFLTGWIPFANGIKKLSK